MKFDKIVVYWEGNVLIETFLDYEQQVGTDFGYIGVHWEGNSWTWPDHSKINFTNNWSGTDIIINSLVRYVSGFFSSGNRLLFCLFFGLSLPSSPRPLSLSSSYRYKV